jgi:CDP-diacylglycerol--glycerol-3-phosphate 3-phosphatidyltransferase
LPPSAAKPIPRRLRLEWRVWAVIGTLTTAGGFFVLGTLPNIGFHAGAAAAASGALLYVLLSFYRNLAHNHRPGEQPVSSSLGAANRITLIRGVLICLLAGFWGWKLPESRTPDIPAAWIPGMLYITAAVLDGVDGAIARRSGKRTALGSILDTEMDALGLLVAVGVGIRTRQLPPAFLAVGLAYYLFKAAAYRRQKRSAPLISLRPRPEARAMAGLTMGVVGIALLPVYAPPVTTVAAVLFMLPFCYGFVRDWLVVCGTVRSDVEQRTGWELIVGRVFGGWLPPMLRLMIGFTALLLLLPESEALTTGAFGPEVWPTASLRILSAGAPALFVVMVVSGCLGRTAALGLALILGASLHRPEISPDIWALYICSVCLVLSGSGFFSVWRPEDRWLHLSEKRRRF